MRMNLLALLAALLPCAPALAAGATDRPAAAIEFLLGDDPWQPGARYRSGTHWLALACEQATCRLEPAKLTVRREPWQGHYDDKPTMGQKLVFQRQAPAATGTVLAWFKQDPAVPWLRPGPVRTYWAATMPKKRPATEGTLEQAVDLPGGSQAALVPLLDAEDKRFLLQLRAQGKRQLLGELGQCSGTVADYLVWAGDIDGDGQPDYLIDFADPVGEAQLYLAREAGAGEIAGLAATYVPPPFDGECDGEGWIAR